MNDLVKKLSKKSPVLVNRPDLSCEALQERIELGYVHVLFKDTETELCVKLDKENCNFENADFKKAKGKIHFEGGITLNYEKVRVLADIDISNMEGKGNLKPIDEKEYKQLMKMS